MSRLNTPKSYPEWRTGQLDRAEDAAHVFGYHLMKYCRSEAIDSVSSATFPENSGELQTLVASAVDVALHNVMDLLEGFWKTNADPNHEVTYALSVCVKRITDSKSLERVEVSPSLVDLPIGYWKWKEGEFR